MNCVESAPKHSSIFLVPFPRNPQFTGRGDILTDIHNHLVINARPGFTASYVLHGLGGVGKTQIAIEYAYEHKTNFDIICWLPANDWNTLVNSYVQLSGIPELISLGIPSLQEGQDHAVAAELAKDWFERTNNATWLLIFDNANKIDEGENMRSLVELIPSGQHGCVLATSRNRASDGELANSGTSLEEMDEDEAIQFLLKCCRQQGLENPNEEPQNLVKKLGYLPLAIEQAGGYIRNQNISIGRYIYLYDANKGELLKAGLPKFHKKRFYEETVATTWKISFEEVDRRDLLASEILRLMAFFDGAKIQIELFEQSGMSLTSNWRLSKASVLNLEQALGCLQSYSLIRRLPENNISVHLLVQQVILGYIEQEASLYFEAALKLVRDQFPWGGELGNLGACLKYLSHALSCVTYGIELESTSYDMTWLLNSVGAFFDSNGQHGEAISYYERALRIKDGEFGVDHIDSADTINNLGIVYSSQGKHNSAISHYEQALKIYAREFGVDHINSANTINNLGIAYASIGKYNEAISYYERALKICDREFGLDHINSANVINNLGLAYKDQGYSDEAISYHERALKIYDREFGFDHINSACTIYNLGIACESRDNYDEAILYYERALKIYNREFGVDHIKSLNTIRNIGNIYGSQGKYEEAMPYSERELKIVEREFGVEHINSADTIYHLGIIYRSQGKYNKAISYHERSLKIKDYEFGMDHINSANTIMGIGTVYGLQGKHEEAMSYYERALKIYDREFGVDHIKSADTIMGIGTVYVSQGKNEEAKSYYKRALKIYDREFGVDHIHSADIIMNMGLIFKAQGQFTSAGEQLLRAYHIFKRNLGEHHPKTQEARSLAYTGF